MEALSRHPLNASKLTSSDEFLEGEEGGGRRSFPVLVEYFHRDAHRWPMFHTVTVPFPIFIGESFFRYDSSPSINGTLPLSRKAWARSMLSLLLRQFHGNFHRGPQPRTGLINFDRIENRFWITGVRCLVLNLEFFSPPFVRCKSNYRNYFFSTINKFDILTFYVTPISFFLIIFDAYYWVLKNVWSFR